jgi:hypothetical protein
MSTYVRRSGWPWIATAIVGLAVAYLGPAVFGQRRRPRLTGSPPTTETSEEADLAAADGAMSDEGAPAASTS